MILGVRGTEFVYARENKRASAARYAVIVMLTACATPDVAVLLPGADGKTGAVAVKQKGAEALLDTLMLPPNRAPVATREQDTPCIGSAAVVRRCARVHAAGAGIVHCVFPEWQRRVYGRVQSRGRELC